MQMTMQQVMYALEVASLQNVSQAAQRLYISQSALSQQLRRLEQELGYPLFTRTAKGLELTEEGKSFCELARPVADQWKVLCKRVTRNAGSQKIRLRLGVGSRVYSNNLFARILAYFETNPRLEVTFVTEAGRDALEALRLGEMDMALDRLPPDEQANRQDVYSFPLIRERQCVLMSRSDPMAALEVMTFQDLQGCTMISGLEGSAEDRSMKNMLSKNRITINRVFRSDGIDTSMRMVRDGMGLTLGPESFAEYFHVAAVPLDPELWVSLQFICLHSSLKRPEIRGLRDNLLEYCQRRPSASEFPFE
jgi:DNA-binding transcriptional LysR family regulator